MSDVTPPVDAGSHRGAAPGGVLPGVPSEPLPPRFSAEDVPPPVVQGLRVGRLLGRGGSSAVWLVTDDGGQRFALKVAGPFRAGAGAPDHLGAEPPVPRGRRAAQALIGSSAPEPSAAASTEAQLHEADGERAAPDPGVGAEDMARELRLLQRFSHEHLLRVHRMIGTDQGPGMLMDLASGGSLLNLVTSRGPLPIPEVVTALVPVAQVLSHLHGAGALHGDVTPGNILFTAEGKPLLGDFGTARLLGSDRSAAAGTPGFLDPTQGGPFDSGADVFALAAVSWFALTGRVPGPTEQRPPLVLIVPEVPQQLMQLIEDGLSSTRARRPTADHFARILLSSAAPNPVNLVPAVHSSVLPDLVTRRAGPRPAVPQPLWKRIIGGRGSTRKGKPGARRPPLPGGEASLRGGKTRRGASARTSARRGPVGPGDRARNSLAIAAALAAVVLLVAGIAVTLGGFRAPPAVLPGSVPGAGSSAGSGSSTGSGSGAGPGSSAGSGSSAGQGATGREGADPGSEGDEGTEGSGGVDVPSEPSADALLTGDPVTALRSLAALRATAFTTADTSVLKTVDVEGSPALSADQKAVAALADSGRNLRDLSIGIRDPVVLGGTELAAMPAVGNLPGVTGAPGGTQVSLIRATAELSSYTESAASSPRAEAEPSPLMTADQQELIFILWKSGPAWQIHSVVSPPG